LKLPNGDRAIVPEAKLRDYCLNVEHPWGKNKARVFRAALGMGLEDLPKLAARLREAASTSEARQIESIEYGERYIVDFEMANGPSRAMCRSAWIVRRGEVVPRLTSCYVL
jgi:hypothetical protein